MDGRVFLLEEVYRVSSEYWFLDYYRVLKVRSNDKYVLSVDVYRRRYPFRPEEENCLEDGKYCIYYNRIDPGETGVKGVIDVIVTGIKAGKVVETVNVRWILDHDPQYSEIEEIFKKSWIIIGCRPPSDPWVDPCGKA